MEQLLIISSVNPSTDVNTSTDIMFNNILAGFKDNEIEVTLLAICKIDQNRDEVINFYSNYAKTVIVSDSFFSNSQSKYEYLLKLLHYTINLNNYRLKIRDIGEDFFDKFDRVIVNHVTYDEICYMRAIKEVNSAASYIEYWSDPMSISGINPEDLKFKISRWPFYFIEKKALGFADYIVYGTKTLMEFQKSIFKTHAKKMRYIDIAYLDCKDASIPTGSYPKKLLYAGNYYRDTRDIIPLVKAVSCRKDVSLYVYGNGDTDIGYTNNIHVSKRISKNELELLENNFDCQVCILNKKCIQIPGKVFYGMSRPGSIIVIVDGSHQDAIIKYLETFERFLLCSNNMDSINSVLDKLDSIDTSSKKFCRERYSPKKVSWDLLCGGRD